MQLIKPTVGLLLALGRLAVVEAASGVTTFNDVCGDQPPPEFVH